MVGRRLDRHAGHLLVRAGRPAVRGPLAAEADRTAAEITCGAMKRDPARWRLTYAECLGYRTRLPAKAPVRFQRIFTSRPGYPLLAVPFVRVMGTTGFAAATAALGVACGIAVVLLALAIGLRPVQALMAETLFYLLPTGLWGSRLLAEAPMMLCLLVALIGTVLLLRGRNVKTAVGLLACGLALLCAVKPPTELPWPPRWPRAPCCRSPSSRRAGRPWRSPVSRRSSWRAISGSVPLFTYPEFTKPCRTLSPAISAFPT